MSLARLTLVLLPGLDGTGNLFDPLIHALGGRCALTVVRYPTDRAAGYAELTEYAATHLPREGDFVLLGESFSGPIAVALAASRPPGLIGLVLCCTFLTNPRPALAPFAPLSRVLPFAGGPALHYLLLGRRATPGLRALLESSVRQVSPQAMRARVDAVLKVDVTDAMRKVEVPVLYIGGGRKDRVVPPSAGAAIAQAAPLTRFVRLDAPHCLLQTMPEEAADAIASAMEEWRFA